MKKKVFLTQQKAQELFPDIEIKSGVWVKLLDDKSMKSDEQNKLFHSLLGIFWDSGCSSYETADKMRFHYKDIAGLITYEYISGLNKNTRLLLWKILLISKFKNLVPEQQNNRVNELLKGKVFKEKSWSYVSKKKATEAIQALIDDMYKAGVNSPKFEEVMKTIGEYDV